MIISVGIDVAKDKHDCCIISSEGEVLADVFTISNTMEGFRYMQKSLFPGYSVGPDAYEDIVTVCALYGKKVAIIGGRRALAAAQAKILKAIENSQLEVIGCFWYGGEASVENMDFHTRSFSRTLRGRLCLFDRAGYLSLGHGGGRRTVCAGLRRHCGGGGGAGSGGHCR